MVVLPILGSTLGPFSSNSRCAPAPQTHHCSSLAKFNDFPPRRTSNKISTLLVWWALRKDNFFILNHFESQDDAKLEAKVEAKPIQKGIEK